MEYFQRLGAAIEDAWCEVDRDHERFPDVAGSALDRLPPAEHFDREAFLDRALDWRETALRQLAPLGTFGQPGLTVHHGQGFVIEVYYWLNSNSAIHNHPFCGVFTILEGFSVHAIYRVEERERMGPRAWVGKVELDEMRLLAAGDRQCFSLESHPLVHALIHVPIPSISLVVRTIHTPGYLHYLPPSIALPITPLEEPLARRLALLESLARAGDPRYPERLETLLVRADFETAVRVLSDGWGAWDAARREELLELLRPRFGAHVDSIGAALLRDIRTSEASAIREGLRDPEQRLVATVLAYAERRDQVLSLLKERGDPIVQLHGFVEGAGLFAPDEEASAIIARALIDGEGRAGAIDRLVAEYGSELVSSQRDEVARYCEESIFAPLVS